MSDATPNLPADTLAFEGLGEFRLGMHVKQAEGIVASREERLQCHLRQGRFLCTPEGDDRYSLMFEQDTLVLLGWRLPMTAASLQTRYGSLGTLAASGPASDTLEATLSLWLNNDSTAERMAICTSLRGAPSCSVTLTRSEPAELPSRIRQLQATFAGRDRRRSPT